jgi:hypothetical protein
VNRPSSQLQTAWLSHINLFIIPSFCRCRLCVHLNGACISYFLNYLLYYIFTFISIVRPYHACYLFQHRCAVLNVTSCPQFLLRTLRHAGDYAVISVKIIIWDNQLAMKIGELMSHLYATKCNEKCLYLRS